MEFMVAVNVEVIALWASWSAISFPGIPMWPGIHTN